MVITRAIDIPRVCGRAVWEEVLHKLVDVDPVIPLEDRFVLKQVLELVAGKRKTVVNLRIEEVIHCDIISAFEIVSCKRLPNCQFQLYLT